MAAGTTSTGDGPAASTGRQDPPANKLLYLRPSYWDERFEEEQHYEWFKDYSHFRHLVLKHIKPTDKVLEVGAGSSRLSEDMYRDDIQHITCTDLSKVAVERMRERFVGLPGMVAAEADMLNLPFDNESFDVVIEKGAMDVFFVDSGDPWNPQPEAANRVRAMLAEAHRVLTPTGVFITIAFGQPHFRRPFFEAEGLTWSMKYETFGDSFHYFVYSLVKGTKDPSKSTSLQNAVLPNAVDMEHENMDSEDYLLKSGLSDEED
ncbi:hypothetical protein KC19_VG120800 [Ceratodon purpureus]|uniref:EEF1A lysine methyltransferase 4 n=1 Tax=Ceratodon purpureus TaxID=3225 RepID=A0A8T0HPC4_CERPU|nr:hypothetical protein KC19_VG120800 [Ceratodon purpureus]